MLEFSAYSLILFVHILSGLVLFATSLFAPLTLGQIRSARTLSELRTWVTFEHRSTKWNPAAAFVLLATGIYLGSYGWWTQPWFAVSIASWVLSSFLAGAIVGRTTGLLLKGALAGVDGEVPADLERLRWSPRWTAASAALMANDLAILYVMFNKPDLAASIGLLVVANALLIGIALLKGARPLKGPGPDAATGLRSAT